MSSMSWERCRVDNSQQSGSDLLVFGYSSKLFKDDNKARYIEEGKHLIPWMGDECLLIDRFDVRGYLQDVKVYENKLIPSDDDNSLNADDSEIEKLCNEERFRDLQPEQDLHEEEIKRLRAALADEGPYHEISFNYDENNGQIDANQVSKEDEKSKAEQDFKLPNGLTVPDNIQRPPTNKMHNLIEKTASFISKHGAQMEILIKTKQSSNPQFNFLSFDSPLFPYYKYLVSLIKSGKYTPQSDEKESESEESDDEHYLHPSLLGTSKANKSPCKPLVIPKLPRTGNENDSYSQLVKSLKDKIVPVTEQEENQPFNNSNNDNNNNNNNNEDENNSSKEKTEESPSFSQSIVTLECGMHNSLSLLPSPPPDVDFIIEKLAHFVANKGEEFEQTIRKRGEERFEFLNPGNIFHAHYIRRKLFFLEEKRKISANELKMKKSSNETDTSKQAPKNTISFSISVKDKKKFSSCDTNIETEEKLKPSRDIPSPDSDINISSPENQTKEKQSKEKQLQEERKKKAALFVSMLKSRQLKTEQITDNSNNNSNNNSSNNNKPVIDKEETNNSCSLSPTTQAVTSSQSPLNSEQTSHRIANNDIRPISLLPFVSADKPTERSSRSSKKSHKHRRHRGRHSSHKYRSKSRSPSSRSHSRSRSRSRSRSKTRRKRYHSSTSTSRKSKKH